MKRSIFLPMFVIMGLLSFVPLDAANYLQNCDKATIEAIVKGALSFSPSKAQLDMAERKKQVINRRAKAALFGGKVDYIKVQFWLDRDLVLEQEFKDQKLRETLCARDCTGIRFWLKNGASLANLTGKHCKDGLAKGGAWTEIDADGKMILFVDSGRYMDAGMVLLPGEGSDKQMLDLLKGYDVCQVKFWYDFPLVRNPEVYLAQIQSGVRTGLER